MVKIKNHTDTVDRTQIRYNAMQLMQALRSQIEAGTLPRGTYLPAVRQLSRVHGVAGNTVLRALRMLLDQGLLESRPRRGYWICETQPTTVSFAYLMSTENIYAGFDALYKCLMQEFRACTGSRGEHFTTIVLHPGDEQHTIRQHGLAQVNGLVLDTPNEALIAWARKLGIATVLIDDEDPLRRVHAAVQGNFEGGARAVEHLLASGCKRIAWFGKTLDHHHARSRYGGALSSLVAAQSRFSTEHFLPLVAREEPLQLERAARAMLEQRPDGVLALWRPMAEAVVAAARQLGMKPGADFQFVGWTCAELLESSYTPLFDGQAPPAIVWSARRMAEVALDHLRMAAKFPDGEAAATIIPVSLQIDRGVAKQEPAFAAATLPT